MTFISYAQNFEDVMLWRALKHVENGFYIDVGANDPSIDSVTKVFYERGWSGINVEPLSSHHADLQQERPRDINLRCAAGAVHGEIDIWECDVRGWATADKSVVALHSANGHQGTFHKVPVRPLSEICAENVKGEIHFLKIDVEGFEKSVIEGIDFSHFRPWILVIEATRPNSSEEVHGEWEGMVLSNNYLLAYTDGLNRFYVAGEHSELLVALRYPPNVFDDFIRIEQLNSAISAQKAEAKAQQAQTREAEAQSQVQQALQVAQQAQQIAQQADAKAQQAQTREAEAQSQVQQALQVAQQAQQTAQQAEAKAQQAQTREAEAQSQMKQALQVAQQAETTLEAVKFELNNVHQSNHFHWQLAESKSQQILALTNSNSWRITKPLRVVKSIVSGEFTDLSRVTGVLKVKLKQLVRPPLSASISYVNKHPAWRNRLKRLLKRFPWIYARLLRVAINTGVLTGGNLPVLSSQNVEKALPVELNNITPHARRIYYGLKAAFENKNRVD